MVKPMNHAEERKQFFEETQMPESLYHPGLDHHAQANENESCRPNGFGLCQTHVTCGHVKESLHEANMQIERLRQEARRDNANIERKQEEINSLRNACRMNNDTIAELRKEIADYQHSTTQHVEVRNDQGDRIDRWRNEIREAYRILNWHGYSTAMRKLEMLLGEE